MTHYVRDECYHNNKNDALSTDSRPIYNYDEERSGAYMYGDYEAPDNYGSDVDWNQANEQMFEHKSFKQNYVSYTDTCGTDLPKLPSNEVGSDECWEPANDYGGVEYDYGSSIASGPMNGCDSSIIQCASDIQATVEGMYVKRGNRVGCRLPATPEMDSSKYRMLPKPVAYRNAHAHNNLNGHSGYATNAGLLDERIGSFISLPAAPMRMLPEPQPRPRSSNRFFEDGIVNTDGTSNRNIRDELSSSIQSVTSATGALGRGTNTHDVFSQMSRPYTSMLPLDYTDYPDYSCNLDKLSAYSDTPPMSNSQHMLQQQRKISLMMAMTTASVIASGETRVPVQHSNRRIEQYSDLATMPFSNPNYVISSADSTRTSSVAFSNATTIASSWWSKPDLSSKLTSTATTTTTVTTITTTTTPTRKLPKRLPSPAVQYKPSSLSYSTGASVHDVLPDDAALQTKAQSETIHRTKQLPKLPVPKAISIPKSVPTLSADSNSSRLELVTLESTVLVSSPSNLTMAVSSPCCSSLTSLTTTVYFNSANNTPHIEENDMENEKSKALCSGIQQPHLHYQNRRQSEIVKSVDSFKSWSTSSTLTDSPSLLYPSEFCCDKNLLKSSEPVSIGHPAIDLESSSDKPLSISTSHHNSTFTAITNNIATITLNEAKASSFDISEYVKPYQTYSFKLTENDSELDRIQKSIPKGNAHDAYESSVGRKDELLDSSPLGALSSETPNQNFKSISTWSTTPISIDPLSLRKGEMMNTPQSESSTPMPYILSKTLLSSMEGTQSDQYSTTNVSHDTLNHSCNVFTTVVAPTSSTIYTTVMSPAATIAPTPISPPTIVSSPTLSYVDYMKKFELPELPPILGICSYEDIGVEANVRLPTTTEGLTWKYSSSRLDDIDTKTQAHGNDVTSLQERTEFPELGTSGYKANDQDNENPSWLTSTPKMLSMSSVLPSETETTDSKFPVMTTAEPDVDTCRQPQDVERPKAIGEDTMENPSDLILNHHIEEPTACNSSAFDDSFYDSFNVDLSALTATIAHIESDTFLTPALMPNNNEAFIDSNVYMKSSETLHACEPREVSGGYYRPPQKQQHASEEAPPTPQKSKAVASAATTVLGGLSKGIKGGLDGVLSGVNSTMEATKQQYPASNSKKGFGFGLASKLVPGVGGLLSSASNKQQADQQQQNTVSIPISTVAPVTTVDSSQSIMASKNAPLRYDTPGFYDVPGGYEYDQFTDSMAINSNAHIPVPVCKPKQTFDHFENNGRENSKADLLGFHSDNNDYSEYPSDNIYSYQDRYIEHASNEIEMGTNSTAVTASNAICKPDIEVGSIVKVETPKSQPITPKVSAKKSGSNSSAGGMFGSFIGKAAAAVQSATLAVNQGASSVASAVAQKTSVSDATSGIVDSQVRQTKDSPTITSSSYTVVTNIPFQAVTQPKNVPTMGYDNFMDNDYNEIVSSQEDSTAADKFVATGADYENRNTHGTITMNDNKSYSMYYSDGDQNQLNDNKIVAGQKMLPTVPSAESTGKKLPTINGKSGMLMKQQPTEIFDDESDEDVDDDLVDNLMVHPTNDRVDLDPSYCIDSEQNDYYMDHQQTTPSSRAANDYYEHVGAGGFDYHEDFFNEEDEYKYLEQQTQQQQQDPQHHHIHQNLYPHRHDPHQLMLSHKQSSVDYVDDGQNNDYLNETYPSDEDIGNYLDESSSGSVGIAESRKQQADNRIMTPSITPLEQGAVRGTTTVGIVLQQGESHHQMQKQESNIVEEDESCSADLKSDRLVSAIHLSPDADPDDGEDHLADLVPVISSVKKKKVLMRGETEEVVSGHMQILRKPEITAKQRWHWAYNKIILQLNVSSNFHYLIS